MKVARRRDSLEALLRGGLAAQSAGDLASAIEKYRAALVFDPRCADAHHLLAQVRHVQGEHSEALALAQRAVALAPRIAMYRCTLGVILRALGSARDALAAFQTSLSLDPRYVSAQRNVAALLAAMGNAEEARAAYAKALALDATHVDTWLALARLLVEGGRPGEGAAAAERAVELDPRHAGALQAWYGAALAANAMPVVEPLLARLFAQDPANLDAGLLLVDARLKVDAAEAALEVAAALVRTAPADARCWRRLGLALAALTRQAEAGEAFARALELNPDDDVSGIGLGNTWQRRRRPDLALAAYDSIIARRPAIREAWYNSGVALGELDREEEAVHRYDRALEIDGGYGAALNNRAQSLLRLGRLRAAWSDYRWRDGARMMPAPEQRWPDTLAGRRIHVHAEQGIGDHLFFLRFVPLVSARGAAVTVEAERRIEPMVVRSGLVPVDVAPDGAECVRMGDLPWLLGCGDDDLPPPIELPPLADRVARVEAEFGSRDLPVIGVTWRAGGTKGKQDTTKLVPPEVLGAALRNTRAMIVSVQRLPRTGEHATFEAGLGREVVDLSGWNDDLELMLALMARLDGYVGVSNANVHLRCGVGLGSDILVPFPMDWRWRCTTRGDAPWYPGSHGYHQRADGDWGPAIAAFEQALAARWP